MFQKKNSFQRNAEKAKKKNNGTKKRKLSFNNIKIGNFKIGKFCLTVLKILILLIVTFGCIGAGLLGGAILGYIRTAEPITKEQLEIKKETSYVYDSKGNEIARFTG